MAKSALWLQGTGDHPIRRLGIQDRVHPIEDPWIGRPERRWVCFPQWFCLKYHSVPILFTISLNGSYFFRVIFGPFHVWRLLGPIPGGPSGGRRSWSVLFCWGGFSPIEKGRGMCVVLLVCLLISVCFCFGLVLSVSVLIFASFFQRGQGFLLPLSNQL